jgi:hypothetical protein
VEKLNQLGFIFITAFYLLGAPRAISAQNYCSLRVQVLTPSGQRPGALVEVRERNGRKIEKEQAPGHDLEFCDLGLLPVTVVVGLKDCEVVISDVNLSWGQPYTLKVTYDQERCMDERPKAPKPFCRVLLRVNTPVKKWISAATVKFDESSRPPMQTDQSGRALFSVGLNERVHGFVTASGYNSKEFSVACSEPKDQEEMLTLTKH